MAGLEKWGSYNRAILKKKKKWEGGREGNVTNNNGQRKLSK